jgi:hypothetical protein
MPDRGLKGACIGGHKELAELMIARGANDWNYGLSGACFAGHKELAEFMIARGARDCDTCKIKTC